MLSVMLLKKTIIMAHKYAVSKPILKESMAWSRRKKDSSKRFEVRDTRHKFILISTKGFGQLFFI